MVALVLVALVVVLPGLQRLWRALYWSMRRDADGRPVTLAPVFPGSGPRLVRRVAAANRAGTEMDEVIKIIAESGSLTCRVSPFFNDHLVMLTGDPDIVAWITARNFENYDKGPRFVRQFKDLLGEGIFNSNGRVWKSHREIAKPHFARDELLDMVTVFNRHADDLVRELETVADAGPAATIDVQKLFRRFTMDSFGDAFFGVDLGTLRQPSEFARHFDFLQRAFSWRFRVGPLWQLWGLTPRMKTSVDYLDRFFKDLIAAARCDETLPDRTDLLAHYLRSRNDDGSEFTDDYLRDMLLNFLLAGRDTTAALITWLVYCLASHPEVEQKLLEEIERVVGAESDPTAAQLTELRYMKQVFNETLRLYPPVPCNIRTSVKDDVLPNGYFIPAGTDVLWSTWCFQRSEKYWGSNALEFCPERWTEDRAAQLRSFSFVPFHAGPRICLGQNMAYTEAKVALVRILQRFRLQHDPSCPPLPVDNIVLASANGMKAFVTRRAPA